MRAMVIVIAILAVLWGGYWFVGSTALQRGAESWFQQQVAAGKIARNSGLIVRGFPNRFDLTVEGVKVADPATGFGWQATFVQVFALSYKPWHAIAALPNDQVITTPGGDIGITSEKLMASVRVSPDTTLSLQQAGLEGTGLTIASAKGWQLGIADALFAMRADGIADAGYDISLSAPGITPDPMLLAAAPGATALPPTIKTAQFEMHLVLSAPLDRASAETRPRIVTLEVKNTLLEWGDLRVMIRGTLAPDVNGYADGQIDIDVANWPILPTALAALGAVTPEVAPTFGNMLQVMADQDADPSLLNLTLAMKDGVMRLGPLPIGPAPLLVPPSQ